MTFNVRGRDLGTTVGDAIQQIATKVKMPPGYHVGWSGEYESEQRAEARLAIVVPLTILVIFIILYTMFHSLQIRPLSDSAGMMAMALRGRFAGAGGLRELISAYPPASECWRFSACRCKPASS